MSDNENTNMSESSGVESRQVILMKKGQRFVFRYECGQEMQLLNHLICLADDNDSDLDWFDVAVLSHQIGQRMGHQLQKLMKSA